MKFILILLMLSSYAVLADDDDSSSRKKITQTKKVDDDSSSSKKPGVVPVNNLLYTEECSACHFAYQPGLLPARSWQKLMINLADHFGENAELEAEEQKALTAYMIKNAAEFSKHKRSVKIMRSLAKDVTPLRIIEIPYIVKKHDDLTPKMVAENPEVKSLSYCDKCHTNAVTGSYSENDIVVPGYGNWEEYEHSSGFLGSIKNDAKKLYKDIVGND
ncbi:diheme cytochrome c [Candidatus Halobeggiatoa sp. HSG11]|nr:diheme cytochrome c [Candidatus Halobeggiatoa sp. HSG11]